jgi:hypothetical protein
MKKKIIRFCPICKGLIPEDKNGNTVYCSDECYDYNKSVVAAEKNRNKSIQKLLFTIDNVANEVYGLYGSEPFSANVFIDRGFVWDTYSEIITIEHIQAKKLIRYAYVLFTNQTVKLWKL